MLVAVEIRAEGKHRQQPACAEGTQPRHQRLGQVRPRRVGNAPVARQLAGRLYALDEAFLESCVRDADHRRSDLRVGSPAQVGDTIFGDDDVAQVTGNGLVAIVEDDVRLRAPARLACRA